MNKRPLYTVKSILTGLLIYGIGDGIAALLVGEFSFQRIIGMALIGAFLYGLEIPHYFQWVESKTQSIEGWSLIAAKTTLAMLYFNPLWVARHLAFIMLLNGYPVSGDIIMVALHSFLTALPITILANVIIQNVIHLKHRFMASAMFSCSMAIIYPLIAYWVAN